MTWFRYGFASVILAAGAVGTLAVGCGGDDNIQAVDGGSHTDAKADNFVPTDGGGNEGGGNEGGGDAEAGPGPKHGKIIVTHASPDLFALRFCFATGQADDGSDAKVSPLAALPHDDVASAAAGLPFPALFAGTGGAIPDLIDLSKVAITGFVLNAAKITGEVKSNANEKTCDTLIGNQGQGGTLSGTASPPDFYKLKTIPKGTFASLTTHIIALNGCKPGTTLIGAATKCGPNFDATNGNLNLKIIQVDTATTDGGMGVQVFHASSPYDAYLKLASANTYVGVLGGFLNLAADGGPAPISQPIGPSVFGDFKPTVAQPNPGLGAADPTTTAFYAQAINADAGKIGAPVALPLNIIQRLSAQGNPVDGGAGSEFANGFNYTFIFLGDPDPTIGQLGGPDGGPAYDGHGVHVIAFSNDPVLGKL